MFLLLLLCFAMLCYVLAMVVLCVAMFCDVFICFAMLLQRETNISGLIGLFAISSFSGGASGRANKNIAKHSKT